MNGKQWPQWLQEILKTKGYRITAGREAILNILVHADDEHLSAEDIYLKVHSTHPAIGLTSVYRTLETLLNMGLVHKFDFQEGRARYEISEGQRGKHHHHLVCTGCGRIIDHTDFLDDELSLLKRTQDRLSDKYHFKITNHLVQFYGLCSSCHEKEKV